MSLFKDKAQLLAAIPSIHAQIEFTKFEPYITDADSLYLIKYIGQEFYSELVTQNNTDALTVNNQKVFSIIQQASGYYGVYQSLKFNMVSIGNVGASETANRETSAVRQWVFNISHVNAIRTADSILDTALAIMEKTPTDFATWKASSAYSDHQELFITSADEFSKYRNINGSRRTFLALKSFIANAEHNKVKAAIGITLFDTLKTTIKDESITAENTTLLPYIERFTAHHSLWEGAEQLALDISAGGIRTISESEGVSSRITSNDQLYNTWKNEMRAQADTYYAQLKQFLDKNIADYPDYESDDASGNATPNYNLADNSKMKGGFSI